MNYIFIINPLAGKGGAEALIREGISNSRQKFDCQVYLTRDVGDATDYVRNWCRSHPDEEVRFFACGGDGTINEVFNGAVGFPNAQVSCYPCGSGNDFVKAFGGAEKFTDIQRLLDAPVQKLDLMKVGDRYSNNVIDFGFDTTVAIKVNDDRAKTGHGSKRSYTMGVAKALITSMKNSYTVIADGEVLNPDGKSLLCTVANGQYVGGSFRCAPRAKTDDGIIEVCLVHPVSRLKFLKLMTPYTNGEHIDNPAFKKYIEYRQAKKVEIIAENGFAITIDGEVVYGNRFTVEMVPAALNLAVPE